MKGLIINNLSVKLTNGQLIIKGLSLEFADNTIYALVGPNGAGKSSLVNTIMGHPDYKISNGKILLDGKDITKLNVTERARLGLFLGMQYPVELVGVSYSDYLRTALTSLGKMPDNWFDKLSLLDQYARALGFRNFNSNRDLNVGFSGGEKKKSEILQMLMLQPRFAMLDEPDSGLDKASITKLAALLKSLDYPTSLIIISHHDKLLSELHPAKTYHLEPIDA